MHNYNYNCASLVEATRSAIGGVAEAQPTTAVDDVFRKKRHETAFAMVVYHDGGYTPAKNSATGKDTAGWGYQKKSGLAAACREFPPLGHG